MKHEKRNQRIMALIAVILLASAYFAFGQDVKARSFRDESKEEYDVKRYFNLALLTYSEGKLEQTDSVYIAIRERDSTNAVMFVVCEKTDFYFAYDRVYLVSIARRGYSTANLIVSSGVKVKEYGTFIPVYLDKKKVARSIGGVFWDSRINDINYSSKPCAFW